MDWSSSLSHCSSSGYYGDWLALAPAAPKGQVTGWSHLLSIHRFIEIAQHAGKSEDALQYNATLVKLKKAYHNFWWEPNTKSYGPSQTANLLPLYLDIPPPELVADASAAYVGAVLKNGNHTDSGIIGSAYMLQTLKKIGRGDLALSIALGANSQRFR
jgi:alpha-L-rhamnosidase